VNQNCLLLKLTLLAAGTVRCWKRRKRRNMLLLVTWWCNG